MLYPQNGDGFLTIDSVTSHHPVYISTMSDAIAGASCDAGDLSMDSKCYRKFDNLAGWFAASNDCFSFGGSLAVFSDLGRPSDNGRLTDWLAGFGTDKTYWVGLVNPWWMTVDEGDAILNASSSSVLRKVNLRVNFVAITSRPRAINNS